MIRDDKTDLLKRATAAAVRALSGATDLIVDYGTTSSPILGLAGRDRVRLRQPDDVTALRGEADALAAAEKYHDAVLHQKLLRRASAAGAPDGVIEALEETRTMLLAAKAHKGVALNLAAQLDHDLHDGTDIGRALRAALWQAQLPEASSILIAKAADKAKAADVSRLSNVVADQAAFAGAALDLLDGLGLLAPPSGEADPEDAQDAPETMEADEVPDNAEEQPGEAVEQPSEVDESGADDRGEGASDGAAEEMRDEPVQKQQAEAAPPPDEALTIGDLPYRVFTTAYDEVAAADTLASADELTRLRAMLDQQLQAMHGLVAKLAHRLQRKLLAAQTRAWEFDIEEGLINSGRLPRLVIDPTATAIYKRERDTDFRDTVVTLVLDNSGSMRGRPITIAALSADILARTLERCGVKVEILGFTTRAWKGGRAREDWQAAGKPPLPGRLNELRHIVYKEADAPYRRARKGLALMLREGLLKENIDGEALLWAATRLSRRTERRKIMMVISDGAPVDDATLSANPSGYLEEHLHAAIGWIERRTNIELLAIGIGHDVTRYYRRAVKISDVDALGPTMTKELAALF